MELNKKTTPRSGWEFEVREKAYHVYMYSLQKKNYGQTIRGYARVHNLKRDTLRSWIERYPEGKPFYDSNNINQQIQKPVKAECQMVKLSPRQIEKPLSITDSQQNGIINIDYHGAIIHVETKDLMPVLAAIKSLNGLLQ